MSRSQPKKPESEAARDPVRIRALALKLLARREHAVRELSAKLVARGYESVTVAQVVDELADRNLVSDGRFVDEFVAAHVRRGDGPLKIREALHGRGVDEHLVEIAVSAHRDEWFSNAEAARRKRFGAVAPRSYQERARQARFLQQRGFTTEQIRQVLKGDLENL